MGLIRILLALAVVGTHCNSHPLLKFVGGLVAVQAFFVISGFYMAMIIDTYDSAKTFWISRYMRLYPTYIVCAMLTLFLLHGVQNYLAQITTLPNLATIFIAFTNTTILFQDITMFLGIDNNALSFFKYFGDSSPPLYAFLLIPQGWTLGLEISFYILAPYILKRSISTITLFMAVSFLFRVLTITLFGFTDPWTHRFFPTELATFLLGSVAYKMSSRPKNKEKNILFQYISFASIIFFLLTFSFIPLDDELKKIAFILLLSLTIGDIFCITKNSKLDTITGHLSYPIYVSHIFVTEYLLQKLHLPIPNGRFLNTLFVYSAVLLFSAVLYFTLEKPMNAFRRRFKNR